MAEKNEGLFMQVIAPIMSNFKTFKNFKFYALTYNSEMIKMIGNG